MIHLSDEYGQQVETVFVEDMVEHVEIEETIEEMIVDSMNRNYLLMFA